MSNKNHSKAEENQEPLADSENEFVTSSEGESAESVSGDADELAQAREESRRNQELYLRTVADLENYRKRAMREKEELRQYVAAALIEKFLPVLDNLELGLQTAANHPEAKEVADGFALVGNQIRSIFEQNGVEEIDPVGEPFDPHQHEAMANQAHDEIPEGHVSHVIRKGYSLNGRLLRAASVLVSSGPAAGAEEG